MEVAASSPVGPSNAQIDRVRMNLINFLLEVCPPLIGCSRSQLQPTLTRKVESELLKKFVVDIHCRVLVGKEQEKKIFVSARR